MKKKLAVFLLLSCSVLTFARGFTIKLGTTTNPRVQVDFDDGEIYDRTGNINLELTGAMAENMDIGGGIEFNNQLEKNGQKLDVGYTPIYVTFRKRYGDLNATVFPYVIGRAGIALPVDYDDDDDISVDGGVHFGGGAGIEFNNFLVEAIATLTAFQTSGSDSLIEDGQTNVSKITINFGYRFGPNYGEKKEKPAPVKRAPAKPVRETSTVTEETAVSTEETEVYDELLSPEGEDALSKQQYIDSKISELDQLKEQGIITEEEYQAEKQLILNEF